MLQISTSENLPFLLYFIEQKFWKKQSTNEFIVTTDFFYQLFSKKYFLQ